MDTDTGINLVLSFQVSQWKNNTCLKLILPNSSSSCP